MPLDCEESVGHSCGCPFGLSSETGLLVTTSFSGSDRMDNVLKDHRWPSLPAPQPHRGCPILRVFAKGGYLTDRTRVVRLSGGVDGNKIRSSPHSIDGLLYGDGKSATPRFSGPGPWKARVIGGGGSVEINVNGVAGAARARQESDAIP